jgi:hypothetical protein
MYPTLYSISGRQSHTIMTIDIFIIIIIIIIIIIRMLSQHSQLPHSAFLCVCLLSNRAVSTCLYVGALECLLSTERCSPKSLCRQTKL